MAVYTEIPDEELDAFIACYDIGEVLSIKGIAEGVENSNFLLHTSKAHYILTLYEKRVNSADLPFFLGLMEHANAGGVLCPLPVKNKSGAYLNTLAGRPSAIVTFLEGVSVRKPSALHCAELGRALGQFHIATSTYNGARANSLSVIGWQELAAKIDSGAQKIAGGLHSLIENSIQKSIKEWPQNLPKGIIHADLFPNNVLFLGTKISGVIDFYFACTDYLAYDVAICMNAWCFESDGSFNVTKAQSLLCAYHKIRPLSAVEFAAMPILLRGAALRFLLTRTFDALNCVQGALVKPLDPMEYAKKLEFHNSISKFDDYGLKLLECS